MTSRERVLTAIHCKEPDRVPYMEFSVDRALAHRLLGWPGTATQRASLEVNPYSLSEALQVAERLKMDCLSYVLRAPVYADRLAGKDGRMFYGDGHLKDEADLSMLDLPDPDGASLFAEATQFARGARDYARCFVTRAGVFPTILSMGLEHFSVSLYEDRALVEAVLDAYFDWSCRVASIACSLGFDLYVSTDDMAFKTAPYFSPDLFRELILPRYERLAEHVTVPWIIHSDGNILPFLDDLLSVGIRGIHPLEKGAVDTRAVKRRYGDRLCLLGNVDLNLLGAGTPEQVEQEVRELIRTLGPAGGYIVTSGNSLAGYCIPENVLAMVNAVETYGRYPIEE